MRITDVSFGTLFPGAKEKLMERMESRNDSGYRNINPEGRDWFEGTPIRTRGDYLSDVEAIGKSKNIHIGYSEKYGLCVYKEVVDDKDDPNLTPHPKRVAKLASCDNMTVSAVQKLDNYAGVHMQVLRLQDVAKMLNR